MLPAAFGPGARRSVPSPLPALRSGRGGLRPARLVRAPARPAATAVCGRPRRFPARPFFAGGRPAGRPAAGRPRRYRLRAAPRAAAPPAPGVRGSRSLRGRGGGTLHGGRAPPLPAPAGLAARRSLCAGLACPRSARLPPALSAAALRAGGPARCGGGHGPPGSALPPRAGARPPVSVFLLRVPCAAWGQGAKNAENGAKMGEKRRKRAKIVAKTAHQRYNRGVQNRA